MLSPRPKERAPSFRAPDVAGRLDDTETCIPHQVDNGRPVSFKITRPLAVVVDHTKADIFVLGEETQQPIRRPRLTLAMDVCNPIAAGFCLRLRLRRGCRPARALHLVI